ncbi:glycosyltransferase WbuB [Atopobacter sp. AH10]|uniref:glycosyltransferase family 4 protein n=1 Tax=Atopobacter sp. AH10 TaxID=2315861 RepID=UPI000EF1BC94|nr:glycosyltransferase family 4 protein [Atopobacter sp. AH10]RLK63786.1 glycosyltransferase WbuB [Atopobacter sp. AH10]
MVKRILIISQYFYPEDFRINDMAHDLLERGYDVTVLTGIPNYPEGKFFNGYHFKFQKENWQGIKIIRLPIIPRGSSSVQLVLNYLSFVISGLIFIVTTKPKFDLIFTYEVSPMTQALLGPWLAKRIGCPSILYVLDLWPENIQVAAGINNSLILRSIRRMVNYIYQKTDLILASSKSFVNEIKSYQINPDKVTYWPQYGEEIYHPIEKKREDFNWIHHHDQFVIGFTGNIGNAQGLQILPRVAKLLQEEDLPVLFLIVGDGRFKDDLVKEIKQKNVQSYFQFIDRQPSNVISDILAEVDVAFLSFDDNPIYEKTIPAKLQTYIACAKPVLVSAKGEVERIIKEAKAGLTCPAGDERALLSCIKYFMNMDPEQLKAMGKNARNYFEANFSKTKLMDQLDQLFQKECK